MFCFKNKNNSSSNNAKRQIPGLSKYWRYPTLDSQNNCNLYQKSNLPTIHNSNNNENFSSPNDITIEVSYDNFYTLGVDVMKKKKYAEELKAQIEQKRYLKQLEQEKKKLDDINEELRIEKERKIIEEREKQNNKNKIPVINMLSLPKIEPAKILTPRIAIPDKYKTNKKIEKFGPKIKTRYIYRRIRNEEDTKNYLMEKERDLERFNMNLSNEINKIKNDFDYGMKKLNDELDKINYDIDDKNKKFKLLVNEKFNDLNNGIRNSRNNKNNVEIEHIYSFIKKNKYGKYTVQQYMNNPEVLSSINLLDNRFNLPYINLSHQIIN
jgi:hypothetical protein